MAQIIPFIRPERQPMATPIDPTMERIHAYGRRLAGALGFFLGLCAGAIWFMAFAVLMMGW